MLWNEPNNLSHWNFALDPEWRKFASMTLQASEAVRRVAPSLTLVLGGISPIDPAFVKLLSRYGVLDAVDRISVHGFPLDWNHWSIHDWPNKIQEIEQVTSRPVWVSEAGASSFGAEEVQVFGLLTTAQLLTGRVERIHWYSLFDLPPTWEATTRHRESEGSAYYRHYYMGLVRSDGTPKPAAEAFPPGLGVCQWFHFQDPRLELAVGWLRKLGVRQLRTGMSWADWYRPGAQAWFDRQMQALEEFDVTLTLCYTPAHLGVEAHYAAPPQTAAVAEFAHFASWVVRRYARVQTTARAMPEAA
ncbi:MAG: beta-xylosidase [Terriglobales bacterium]